MKKVQDNKVNEETCKLFCTNCPTYPVSGEHLFCGRGRSKKRIFRMLQCQCYACAVYAKYGLSGDFFCDKGAAETH